MSFKWGCHSLDCQYPDQKIGHFTDSDPSKYFECIFSKLKSYWQTTCVSSFCPLISLSGSFPKHLSFTSLVIIYSPTVDPLCKPNLHYMPWMEVFIIKDVPKKLSTERLITSKSYYFLVPLVYPNYLQVGKAGIWAWKVTKNKRHNYSLLNHIQDLMYLKEQFPGPAKSQIYWRRLHHHAERNPDDS